MQYCSIIDQQADSIEFAAGPTLTKTIHDLHKILDPHETPRKTALAQALHGLCLDGWVMPAVNLLPYYPNGSPNDGREQTPPSDILSAFIPQYLRGKCEPSNEACPAYPISRLRHAQPTCSRSRIHSAISGIFQ